MLYYRVNMVFPDRQLSTTETHPPPNILEQKGVIIPRLQTLLAMGTSASQDQEYKAILGEIASLWGELPQKRPDSEDLLAQANGFTITGETLKGAGILGKADILRNSKDMTLNGCVVYGDYVLMRSIHPTVRDSSIFGFKIGEGSNISILHQLHPDPINSLKNGVYESISSPDAEKKLNGFLLFALGCTSEKLVDFITAHPELITQYYGRSITPLRDQLVQSLATVPKDKRNGIIDLLNDTADTRGHKGNITAAAAYEIDSLLQLFSSGDTYQVEVDNSLLFGNDVLALVKGGIIKNSILAGNILLDGAHVRIFNSYLINKDGKVRPVENERFGQPEEYLEIPSFFK